MAEMPRKLSCQLNIEIISCVVFDICHAAFVAFIVTDTDNSVADGARQVGRVAHDTQ